MSYELCKNHTGSMILLSGEGSMTVQMYSLSGNSLPLTKNTTYKNPRETENRSKCKSTAFKKHYD